MTSTRVPVPIDVPLSASAFVAPVDRCERACVVVCYAARLRRRQAITSPIAPKPDNAIKEGGSGTSMYPRFEGGA
jgi:hypothetical protein